MPRTALSAGTLASIAATAAGLGHVTNAPGRWPPNGSITTSIFVVLVSAQDFLKGIENFTFLPAFTSWSSIEAQCLRGWRLSSSTFPAAYRQQSSLCRQRMGGFEAQHWMGAV